MPAWPQSRASAAIVEFDVSYLKRLKGGPGGNFREPFDMNIESVDHRVARVDIVEGEVEIRPR
jgi:hypothetical protein